MSSAINSLDSTIPSESLAAKSFLTGLVQENGKLKSASYKTIVEGDYIDITDDGTKVKISHETKTAGSVSADASSSTTSVLSDGVPVVTGVTVSYDKGGHVSGISLDSAKMPAAVVPGNGSISFQIAGSEKTKFSANQTANATAFNIPAATSSVYGVVKTGSVAASNTGVVTGGQVHTSVENAKSTLTQNLNNFKAEFASSYNFGGKPTIGGSGVEGNEIATHSYVTSYVANYLNVSQAMVFKGGVAKYGDLPTTGVQAGWTYKVTTNFPSDNTSINGTAVKAGDMIVATTDQTGTDAYAESNWLVVQANVDVATSSTLGLVKSGTTNTANKVYAVNIDSAGGMTVNVPWQNTAQNQYAWSHAYIYNDDTTYTTLSADKTTDAFSVKPGDNIKLTADASDDSFTIGVTGVATNAFKTISNGTSSVTAESPDDVLTLKGSGATTVNYGSNRTITISSTNTDSKVNLITNTTNNNYAIPFCMANHTSGNPSELFFSSGITINPSTKTIAATTFSGKATTAGTADVAKKLSNALTFTFANASGQTGSKSFNGSDPQEIKIATKVSHLENDKNYLVPDDLADPWIDWSPA